MTAKKPAAKKVKVREHERQLRSKPVERPVPKLTPAELFRGARRGRP